jgi:ribosomal protein L28
MTKAQYDAILEVAENGERFWPHDLNVSARTMKALERKGYIRVMGAVTFVTRAGWQAVAK